MKLQETFESLLEGEYGELVGVDVEPLLSGRGDDGEEEETDLGASAVMAGLLGLPASKKQRL